MQCQTVILLGEAENEKSVEFFYKQCIIHFFL